jgi:hypothetical protein
VTYAHFAVPMLLALSLGTTDFFGGEGTFSGARYDAASCPQLSIPKVTLRASWVVPRDALPTIEAAAEAALTNNSHMLNCLAGGASGQIQPRPLSRRV